MSEVFVMMKNEQQLMDTCKEDPIFIFTLIREEKYLMVKKIIENNVVNVNTCDSAGNDVVTRLLKAKQYDLVLKFMKKRNWKVNHQNIDGDTFGHILSLDNSTGAFKVVDQLTKKKNYIPNIKNYRGETVLDRAINNNYVYTAFKILEDKRFNNIDLTTFKNLWNLCIKNTYYGKYSKVNNLEVIVESLEKKELMPTMKELIQQISEHMDMIKVEIMKNHSIALDSIVDFSLVPVNA